MPDDIVVAAVADSSGVLVSIINNPVVGTVIEQLLNTGSIDFLVDHKKTFAANPKTQDHTILCIVDDEICFICSARKSFPQRICFALLEVIQKEYFKNYVGKPTSAAFQKFLKDKMDFFSNNPKADKIREVQSNVDGIQEIMHENIQKMLARGERIESIETMAEDLQSATNTFNEKTKEVRCAMCVNNIKMTICLIITIIAVLLGIAAVIFGVFQFLGYPPFGPMIVGGGGGVA